MAGFKIGYLLRAGALLSALLTVVPSAKADTITYDVNLVDGTTSLTGYIQVAGQLGNLGAFTGSYSQGIVGWDLIGTVGANSVELYASITPGCPIGACGNTSGVEYQSSVTATTTGLFFDFASTNELNTFEFDNIDGSICFNNSGSSCGGTAVQPGIYINIADPQSGYIPPSSDGLIGTVAAVPEPSTWAMMLLGFAGLAFVLRQSRRAVSLA